MIDAMGVKGSSPSLTWKRARRALPRSWRLSPWWPRRRKGFWEAVSICCWLIAPRHWKHMSKKIICQKKVSLVGEEFCDFHQLTFLFIIILSIHSYIVLIWKNSSMCNVFILIKTSINISISIFSLFTLIYL